MDLPCATRVEIRKELETIPTTLVRKLSDDKLTKPFGTLFKQNKLSKKSLAILLEVRQTKEYSILLIEKTRMTDEEFKWMFTLVSDVTTLHGSRSELCLFLGKNSAYLAKLRISYHIVLRFEFFYELYLGMIDYCEVHGVTFTGAMPESFKKTVNEYNKLKGL